MTVSVIFLSNTKNESMFNMTMNAINSLVASEATDFWEIIVVESNPSYLDVANYPENVKVIVPNQVFNFHKFLNIGIKASIGEYIALCNNDLVFHENWFSEILKVSNEFPKILSFSPIGKSIVKNENETFELGYKVMTHIKGWCIVVKKELFKKIGFLDETFDFYYADNDYAMTLKCNNVRHAMVYNSLVDHLEKQSSTNIKCDDDNIESQLFLRKYRIPKYLFDKKYKWVLKNEKCLNGFLKFHNKWGTPNLLYKKNKLADIFIKYHMGIFIRFFFKFRF